MASPEQSQGVGPPDPVDVAAPQPERILHGGREEPVDTAPGQGAACGLQCKALLVLFVCLSATALPYSLGALAVLPRAPPGPAPPAHAQPGMGPGLGVTHGDLLYKPVRRVLVGTLGPEGAVSAEGQSMGTPTAASPLAAGTLPGWQPGSGGAVGLPATSAQLLQALDGPSPGSQHHLVPGSPPGTEWGSQEPTWVPEGSLSPGFGQSMAEPWSVGGRSEGTPSLGEPAAWVPASHPAWLQPLSLPTPAPFPSAALLGKVVPSQLVSPGVNHIPSDASVHASSAWTPMGAPSQSQGAADQPQGDQTLALGTAPAPQTTLCRADLGLGVSSKPPAVVTASDLPLQGRAVTAAQAPSSVPTSEPSTARGFSDVQRGASGARVTPRSCSEQKEEVTPSPGLPGGEDHTSAPPLASLPGVSSALPSERTSGLTQLCPGTMWGPSAATPGMLRDTHPTAISLRGEAALLVNTILAKVLGNGSGLVAAGSTSSPGAASSPGVSHPQALAPFLPAAEPGEAVVSSEKPSDLSSPAVQHTLTPKEAHPALALTRAVGPALTGLGSAAPGATTEPGVTEVPCKDGAAAVASLSPRVPGGTYPSLLGSPAQRPSLHPDSFLLTTPKGTPAAGQGQDLQATKAADLAEAVPSEPRTASAGPAAGPPGPTHASPGSVPPPSSQAHAPEQSSEATHSSGTPSSSPPSYVLASPGAVSSSSSLLGSWTLSVSSGGTHDAWPVSTPSVTSQHPSLAGEHLPTAAGEAFSPSEPVMVGEALSPGVQPPHVLPLRFRLLGVAYTEALSRESSGSYRDLEEEVMQMLNQTLSTYETFLGANILEFMNGSVVVRGEALFRGDAPAPTNSHLIRTVVTEASRGRSLFSWQLEPQSVQSGGFSVENLDPEKLSISLAALQPWGSGTEQVQKLISEVTWSLRALYNVTSFTVTHLSSTNGNLEMDGDLYLDTVVHADAVEVLQALAALATCCVDLMSLSVEGTKLHLQVYPFSFLILNRRFSEDLLDPLAVESQELTRDLGDVVARALRHHRSFLQVVIRGFLPGSLICHGDVVFKDPAPTSLEVLEALVLSVGPNKALAGSDFQVDPYSLAVGEDTLEPPPPEPSFPEYAVAILVACGLCVITVPVILLVCLRTRRHGRWDVTVLWDRRDPEAGTQTLEMDTQGFWAASDQAPEDAGLSWQKDSA